MIISVFPKYEDISGHATTNITLATQGVPWYANFTELPFVFPGAPEAPSTELTISVGAVALASSVVAGVSLALF